jgi:hypothetical protein
MAIGDTSASFARKVGLEGLMLGARDVLVRTEREARIWFYDFP